MSSLSALLHVNNVPASQFDAVMEVLCGSAVSATTDFHEEDHSDKTARRSYHSRKQFAVRTDLSIIQILLPENQCHETPNNC